MNERPDLQAELDRYHKQSLDRAREKLAAIESGKGLGEPVGRSWASLVVHGVVVVPLGLLFLFLGGLMVWEAGVDGLIFGLIMFGVAALFGWIAWAGWRASKPSTPQQALLDFYKSLGRGDFTRAGKLVIPADRDDFPRFQPQIEHLGRPTGRAFPFNRLDGFKQYWNELLRWRDWPYCLVKVNKVKTTEVSDRLAIVDFEVTFIMNTQLWWLLIFVALLIALLVDLATRVVVKQSMRKILVRVGDEWHLFDGGWQSFDEYDTNWLPAASAAGSPYREGR